MLTSFLHGWRSWKRARAAGWLAIIALAIGIGSATAIYSVIHAVLLNPLPYANPDRYYNVFFAWHAHPDWWTTTSYVDYRDYAAQLRAGEAYGCSATDNVNVTFNGQPLHVRGTQTSASILYSFGVRPVLGHLLENSDSDPRGNPSALISTALWRRFGSDPNIVGKPISIDGAPYTIVGVMPAWFRYPIYENDNDVWVSMHPDQNQQKYRGYHYLRCIVKLSSGEQPEQARHDFDRILNGLERQHPTESEPEFTKLYSVLDFATEQIRPSLILLMIAAAALFVITCANVASVLLARAVARARDTAVRVALGATNWQLGVQYFSEGLLISLLGALLGAALSYALVRIVVSIGTDYIPRADDISFNWHVLGFALALAFGCAFLFSLSPLWQASRIAPNDVLSEGTRASASARSHRLLRIFVAAQITLAFGLLALGGMIVQHLNSLNHVNPGFDPAGLLVAHVYAPEQKYKNGQAKTDYEARLDREIRSLPGVENAGFTDLLPPDWGNNTVMRVEGRPIPKNWLATESIEQRFISSNYLQTMRIPLLAGRFLTDTERTDEDIPMVINQTLAKLYWPHGNPVGAYVRIQSWVIRRFQVVGVVGDIKNTGLFRPTRPEFYLSYRDVSPSDMTWVLRSPLPEAVLANELRRAVQRVDPDQPVFDIQPMTAILRNSLSRQRLQSLMISVFALAALILAIVGVYGVVSYTVRQRITEMGTRMALGAAPRSLLRLVLGNGIKLAIIGIVIGLAIVLGCAHLLATSDLHLQLAGPSPFMFASLLMAACTLIACWFPAWRACMLPPMVAIRSDLHLNWNRMRFNYRILTERITESVSHAAEPTNAGTELLASMVDASRRAESFPQALESALDTICATINCQAAYLFDRKAKDQPFRLTVTSPASNAIHAELRPDALLLTRLRNYSSSLPINAEEIEGIRNWALEFAPLHVAELETLAALKARMAVPLLSKEDVIGLLLLAEPYGRSSYTSDEARAVRVAAAQLALVVENSRLTDRIVEQERLRRELLLATEVQKRLFPEKAPETASI
ncbi:MAG: ABC transporter permease, partial [Acidobacteriaceae bacterium]|nr:ABC transporter permease [Acidobacteriaceae bacterium]